MEIWGVLNVEAVRRRGGIQANRHRFAARQIQAAQSAPGVRCAVALNTLPDTFHRTAIQQAEEIPPAHDREDLCGGRNAALAVEHCGEGWMHAARIGRACGRWKVSPVSDERALKARPRGVSAGRHAHSRGEEGLLRTFHHARR